MTKEFKKKLFVSIFALSFILVPAANAVVSESDLWGGSRVDKDVKEKIGLEKKDPRIIVASAIRVIMGFLGTIAVVIILMAGFKWMTAGGSEEKITDSRKMLTAGVIGLIIILAAFGIATFVMNNLAAATL
jgi:hypothetical protein